MVVSTKGRYREHIDRLREELKKEPTAVSDELLRQHLRKLRLAWNPGAMVSEKVA